MSERRCPICLVDAPGPGVDCCDFCAYGPPQTCASPDGSESAELAALREWLAKPPPPFEGGPVHAVVRKTRDVARALLRMVDELRAEINEWAARQKAALVEVTELRANLAEKERQRLVLAGRCFQYGKEFERLAERAEKTEAALRRIMTASDDDCAVDTASAALQSL